MHPSFTPKAHWVTLAMVISLRCPTLAVPSKTKRPSERTAKRSYFLEVKGQVLEKVSLRISIYSILSWYDYLEFTTFWQYKNRYKFNLLEKCHHPNSPFQFNPGHPNVPSKSFVASSHWSPKRHVQVGDGPPPNWQKISGWLLRYGLPLKSTSNFSQKTPQTIF